MSGKSYPMQYRYELELIFFQTKGLWPQMFKLRYLIQMNSLENLQSYMVQIGLRYYSVFFSELFCVPDILDIYIGTLTNKGFISH